MNIRYVVRKNFITGNPNQLKYLGLLMVSMLVPVILVGGCLYFLIFNVMAEQLGIPEYIAYNLSPVIKKINTILLIWFPLLAILIFIWGAILSHRFVGPVDRLKKELEDISKNGDYSKKLKVRRHDELRSLISSINRLLDKVREDRHK